MEAWTPTVSRERLPGPSARTLGVAMAVCGAGASILITVVFAGMLVLDTGYANSPVLTALMGVFGADVLAAVVVVVWASLKSRAEVRTGYTTRADAHPEVDQIDPRTNKVIRMAGEPLLTPALWRTRMDAVRRGRR